ncbi:MAG: Permease of the drug/metabolite transporter (DMT) superfamily, partial [uncultured Frankineae bacterium]
ASASAARAARPGRHVGRVLPAHRGGPAHHDPRHADPAALPAGGAARGGPRLLARAAAEPARAMGCGAAAGAGAAGGPDAAHRDRRAQHPQRPGRHARRGDTAVGRPARARARRRAARAPDLGRAAARARRRRPPARRRHRRCGAARLRPGPAGRARLRGRRGLDGAPVPRRAPPRAAHRRADRQQPAAAAAGPARPADAGAEPAGHRRGGRPRPGGHRPGVRPDVLAHRRGRAGAHHAGDLPGAGVRRGLRHRAARRAGDGARRGRAGPGRGRRVARRPPAAGGPLPHERRGDHRGRCSGHRSPRRRPSPRSPWRVGSRRRRQCRAL